MKKEKLLNLSFLILSPLHPVGIIFMFRKKLENQNFEIFNVSLIIGTILFVCFGFLFTHCSSKKYYVPQGYEFLTQHINLFWMRYYIFHLILDDIQYQKNYTYYYKSVVFYSPLIFLTFSLRYIISGKIVKKIKNGEIGNTIIIGSSKKLSIFLMKNKLPKSSGNKIIGFIKE